MDDQNRTFHDNAPTMLGSVVGSTVNYAIARSISMEKITAMTGLRLEDLIDPEARLSQYFVPKIWQLLSKVYPDEILSLHMASATPFSCFGTLAYGAQYAQNLREALQCLIQYRFVLSERVQLELVETAETARLQIYHPMDELDGGRAGEFALALGTRFLREVLSVNEALLQIEYSHSPFGAQQEYEKFFGIPVLFQQPKNAFVFAMAALDKPIPKCDPQLFQFIQNHLKLASDRLQTQRDDPLADIRRVICENAERGEYSADGLAKKMNVSLRVLQRRAQEHGTTIQRLLETTREENAKELLGDRQLSVEEIAYLVGYSENRSFRRAFKRWTGKSPSQYRKALV
ncbi:transcriptional regulator, AraC family [[Leptolyngbya] sp. PCC 7376]|uniref:AraC family transcriptional regulator n=1 Tax=[Leptolyngbya] sp. PCC 7376 TaxID=111781 RepID=UPI00029EF8D7|nr:AraC family transcriptional regulator [[Leptolyngbya] sp. PCC 7376]AFY37723.1 transcriptional regulator, AraC family [[Leptolyngbya] sp. PCC 7376]